MSHSAGYVPPLTYPIDDTISNSPQSNIPTISKYQSQTEKSENSKNISRIVLNTVHASINPNIHYSWETPQQLQLTQALRNRLPANAILPVYNNSLRIMTRSGNSTVDQFSVHLVPLNQFANISEIDTKYGTWEPDYQISYDLVPTDPYYQSGYQWAIDRLSLPTTWNTQTGSHSIVVSIIDTGVDYNHPDLAANYLPIGHDFYNNDSDPMDDNSHGTHVSGILLAGINNGVGISGVANVSFFAEKVLNATGSGFYSDAISAIYDSINKGANIISNSWGGTVYSSLLEQAVNDAVSSGSLFIASAGNDGSSSPEYPAAFDSAISVSAIQQGDAIASYSNYGNTIDIAAPGTNIYSTLPGNSYGYLSGTSMAAPYVSGAVALLWSQFPQYSNTEIRWLLLNSTEDLGNPGYDPYYGYGLVSPLNAMQGLYAYDIGVNAKQNSFDKTTGNRQFEVSISNFGYSAITSPVVKILVNGIQNGNLNIANLAVGEVIMTNITISSGFEAFNLTVVAQPVINETRLVDNKVEILGKYTTKTAILPEYVNSSIIPVELSVDSFQNANISVLLDNSYLFDVNPDSADFIVNFPVFTTGNHQIELTTRWKDSTFAVLDFNVYLNQSSPLVPLSIGDHMSWKNITSSSSYDILNWTLTSFVSSQQANFSLIQSMYSGGTKTGEQKYWAVIDTTSGYILQSNYLNTRSRFEYLTSLIDYNIGSRLLIGSSWIDIQQISSFANENGLVIVGSIIGDTTYYYTFPTGILNKITYQNSDTLLLLSTTILPEKRSIVLPLNQSLLANSQTSLISFIVNNTGELAETIISSQIILIGANANYTANAIIVFNNEIQSGDIVWYPYQMFEITFDVAVIPTGSYQIAFRLQTSVSDSVNTYYFNLQLNKLDTANPIITTTSDTLKLYEDESFNLVWNIQEEAIKSVSLMIDSTPANPEINSSEVSFEIIGFPVGTHTFNLTVTDQSNNVASNIVTVTIIARSSHNSAGFLDVDMFFMIIAPIMTVAILSKKYTKYDHSSIVD